MVMSWAARPYPGAFQGNPVKIVARRNSTIAKVTDRIRMRAGPSTQKSLASAAPAAQNRARPAGMAATANGSSQANMSASTRKAEPIHHNPARKYPNPNNHPVRAAERIALVLLLPEFPTSPSIRSTRTGNVSQRTGKNETGGKARADAAPADKAIRARRHPQDRIMALVRDDRNGKMANHRLENWMGGHLESAGSQTQVCAISFNRPCWRILCCLPDRQEACPGPTRMMLNLLGARTGIG